MMRVSVVGSSCSGKTTVARCIASRYQIPHIELDAVYWQPDWTPMPLDQYRSMVETFTAGDAWVIDGNYSKVRDIVWARATDVIWMNLPFATVLWRVLKRTVRRIIAQEELFAGNRETVRNAILSRDSLIWWVIRTHRRRTKMIREALESERYSHLKLHEIKKPNDVSSVLDLGEATD
jgi:adenylate kinase family enzyme